MLSPGVTVQWLDNSSTPFMGYVDAAGLQHRVDYDDAKSLTLKYEYARTAGARGVGMWTASGLNYSNATSTEEFWSALKAFRPSMTTETTD